MDPSPGDLEVAAARGRGRGLRGPRGRSRTGKQHRAGDDRQRTHGDGPGRGRARRHRACRRTRVVVGPEEADTLVAVIPSQNRRAVHGGIQWQCRTPRSPASGPTGIVTGRAPGRTEIVATGFGQERRAAVLVHRLPQSLVVTPKPTGTPIQLPVQGRPPHLGRGRGGRQHADSRGADRCGRSPTPQLVAFDPRQGRAHGKGPGPHHAHGGDPRLRAGDLDHRGHPRHHRAGAQPRRPGGGEPGHPACRPARRRRQGDRTPARARVGQRPPRIVAGVRRRGARGRQARPRHRHRDRLLGQGGHRRRARDGDLLVASNRGGAFGIYQMRSAEPDRDAAGAERQRAVGAARALARPHQDRLQLRAGRRGVRPVRDGRGWPQPQAAHHRPRHRRRAGLDARRAAPRVHRRRRRRRRRSSSPSTRTAADSGQLTEGKGGSHSATISPDGRQVAFVSTRDGNPEIYVMPLDGGEARRLTRTGDKESQPRYLPTAR